MGKVKLLGTSFSPFMYKVIWALKIKGVLYEFVDEDLHNKSPLLLKSNPIYQKIPVLLHGQKPICESSIIVEYIDEIWPQKPLLPSDPYEKAEARFWVKFADDKGASLWSLFRTKGEEFEKAKVEALKTLEIVEELGLREKKFFGGDGISIADIAFGAVIHWLEVIEEVAGVKIFEAHKFPRLHAWIKNFKQAPVIKENLPNRDGMAVFFKAWLASA